MAREDRLAARRERPVGELFENGLRVCRSVSRGRNGTEGNSFRAYTQVMKARYWIGLSALAAGAGVAFARRRGALRRSYQLEFPADEQPPVSELGSVLYAGTATTLIQFAGLTVLTDPNFLRRGEKIQIGYGMQATRLTNPAIDFDDLPAIDFVLLSHLHEDHFDRFVQEHLVEDVPILTTMPAARTLRARGFTRTCGLRTWDSVMVRKGPASLRITAMPGTHGPLLVASLLPEVMGSMLEFRDERTGGEYRMYISGDTLVHRDLWEIPRRYPNVDLALLHLGGARVMGISVSMDAEQGIQALKIIGPGLAIPVHYNDYDIFKDPLENFMRAVEDYGLEDKVQYLRRGEGYAFAARSVDTVDQPTF
jgi:L-ascorbate metabolism protein UlaG (beta-lactamase superfamily)